MVTVTLIIIFCLYISFKYILIIYKQHLLTYTYRIIPVQRIILYDIMYKGV